VIRNVVVVRLRPDHDPAVRAELIDGFEHLGLPPGTRSFTVGEDLGLRDGTWSFAIVADFADAAAYRSYDADAEHNRLRARLAPLAEDIARVQFALPD
jgi:hypothetical protein